MAMLQPRMGPDEGQSGEDVELAPSFAIFMCSDLNMSLGHC